MNNANYHERILRVLLYIEQHLDAELTLEYLAGVACFSPWHFHRVFRGMTGEPVMEYIRRLRLEHAAQQLRRTDTPVTRIAFDAGYESHEAFTRAFRARFGAPPSEYREIAESRTEDLPDARIHRLPARRIFFIRHTGPYDGVWEVWARLTRMAGEARLIGRGTEFLGVIHDDPDITEPARLRYDAALTVAPSREPVEGFQVAELPARDYAVLRHKGSYETLSESYAVLCGQWLPFSRREPAWAPAVEFYRNNPETTPPSDLLTDICIPLAD
jgi:AraC family transcriptional regulator